MSEQNPIILFWTAPDEALFAPSVIAAVRNVTPALLERERWQRSGPSISSSLVECSIARPMSCNGSNNSRMIAGRIGVRVGNND
jgi:hypothetical protein